MTISRVLKENQSELKTYKNLKLRVSETFIEGRKLAQEAVEYEKAKTYWIVGSLIEKHVLLNEKRGDYGKKIVNKLASDLDTNQTLLYYALQFARTYKEFPHDRKLSWSHYRALLPVKNEDERSKLEDQVEEWGWSSRQLEKAVSHSKKESKEGSVKEIGTSDICFIPENAYQVISASIEQTKRELDLGFGLSYLPQSLPHHFHVGDVALLASDKGKLEKWKKTLLPRKAKVFKKLYFANLEKQASEKVRVSIDLGFRLKKVQVLPLAKVSLSPGLLPKSAKKDFIAVPLNCSISCENSQNSASDPESILIHEIFE